MDGGFKQRRAYYDEEDVIGSSAKYHRTSCPSIKNINPTNLKKLRSWEEAVELGLKPCGVCKPFHKQPSNEALAPTQKSSGNPIPIVSASELSDLRRRLIQILNNLDRAQQRPQGEGVGNRIARLQREGIIPREIVATMRAITEMRNAVEYESKVLSESQSATVRAAWNTIEEWDSGRA